MTLDDRTKLIKDSIKDPVALSIFLLEDNPGLVKCEGNIYLYNGKCYDLIAREDILKMYHKFVIEYGITGCWGRRNDVVDSVLAYEKLKTAKKMNDHDGLMCANNGIIDIANKKLIPHSSNYYFDSLVDVDYDAKAKACPNFVNYLKHTFNGDEDTINNIVMLGGYLLDSSCKANKMFLFNGCGSNGKSVLIDAFSMFFSDSQLRPQVTSLSLEDLSSDKFKKFDLVTSRFNQCAEAKKGYIDSEEIKKIISGELINVRGIYKDTITFRPKTKIIVACNGLMKFTDTSEGIYRRLVIVNFDNQYRDPEEIKIIAHANSKHIFPWDLELPAKIKAEKSAILNLFLGGLKNLQARKYQFFIGKNIVDAMAEFRRDSETVHEFLNDSYEIDEKADTPLLEIYSHYRAWYRVNVQDSSAMKFRANEMGKRIKEVFGVEGKGKVKVYNKETMQYERLTVYGLKRIVCTPPEEGFDTDNAIKAEEGTLGIQ